MGKSKYEDSAERFLKLTAACLPILNSFAELVLSCLSSLFDHFGILLFFYAGGYNNKALIYSAVNSKKKGLGILI